MNNGFFLRLTNINLHRLRKFININKLAAEKGLDPPIPRI